MPRNIHDLSPVAEGWQRGQSAALAQAFRQLAPVFPRPVAKEPATIPKPSSHDLRALFRVLPGPLEAARASGRAGNVWEIAGLGRNEVRVSLALANLWRVDQIGGCARLFLAGYLDLAIPEVDWGEELAPGYSVVTEHCPIGDQADRIDIVIRTRHHLIAVEVKIDAGEGHRQLERYLASIGRAGGHQSRKSHVVLLAPFRTEIPEVACTTWRDVARAAEFAAGKPVSTRGLSARLIAMFGNYVRSFA